MDRLNRIRQLFVLGSLCLSVVPVRAQGQGAPAAPDPGDVTKTAVPVANPPDKRLTLAPGQPILTSRPIASPPESPRLRVPSSIGAAVKGENPVDGGVGVYGLSTAATGDGEGVRGETNGTAGGGVSGYAHTTTGISAGVYGDALSATGFGVFGNNHATTGDAYGVAGRSHSPDGAGVIGVNRETGGLAIGVRAEVVDGIGVYAVGTDATVGAYGVLTDVQEGIGVWGRSHATTGASIGTQGSATSTTGIGVYGLANATSGVAVGVRGETKSANGFGILSVGSARVEGNLYATGTAHILGNLNVAGLGSNVIGNDLLVGSGLSVGSDLIVGGEQIVGGGLLVGGDLDVGGNLSKGGGSFRIDHPLDPENRILSHSFVESPDMMNIYNGNATLDECGEAWIDLPKWFEALNRDFRYQLTAVGGPGPNLHIASEVASGRFKIAGGSSALKVSWQITGIRHDAYADAHRIVVEEEKPAAQRGFYLHPDAFGQPQTRGIGRGQR